MSIGNRRTAEGSPRGYRFWADPQGKIPPELWTTAHDIQRFWNRLVALREDVAFNCETLPEHAKAVRERFWKLLTSKEDDCKQWRLVVKQESGLLWATRDAVFDRFVTCCRRAAQKKGGWPRLQHRLEHIAILHRFAGGGKPVSKLFISKKQLAWRFGLRSVPNWAYEGKTRQHTNRRRSSGFFGFSRESRIEFRTVLHRRLPPEGVVKGAAWIGRLHPVKGWQWAITITLEDPKPNVERPSLPACGLDLGWRAREGYIRIGMICDSEGNAAELRLPVYAPTSNTRRHSLPYSYRDLAAMDFHIAKLVDDVKTRLQQQLPGDLPAHLKELAAHISRMRQGGLVRLLRGLEKASTLPDAQTILHAWLAENDRLRSLRASLQDRLVGRRRWQYRNMAAFLARRYGTIALEGKLSIKEMIEDKETKDPAFRKSLRYHQWAAVAELRNDILEAADKYGARVVEAKTSWSTTTCHICQAQTTHRPDIKLTCPRGHH